MDNIEEMDQTTIAQTSATVAAKAETASNEDSTAKSSHKRILLGKVTSNKADKTIIVSVVRRVIHPLYKKYFKRTKRFMAHDEMNDCNVGDTVRIRESRPLSARKRWVLDEIVERAK